MLKAKKLRRGDKVAAISLSWGGPGAFPHRYLTGKNQFIQEFGLEVVDRRLGLLEPMLCMLSCRDLLPQSLPCRSERIGAGCVALIPVDDRDRDLAIPDEAPTLWM